MRLINVLFLFCMFAVPAHAEPAVCENIPAAWTDRAFDLISQGAPPKQGFQRSATEHYDRCCAGQNRDGINYPATSVIQEGQCQMGGPGDSLLYPADSDCGRLARTMQWCS